MAKKVYEESNIRAIADKIREKSGSNSTYKTSEMPSGIDEVYEAGQKSMVDESKIIEGTAAGVGSLTLNDVSEIPHNITAQLTNMGTVNAHVIPTAVEVPIEYFTSCDVTILKNIWYDNDEGMYVALVYCEKTTNSLNSGGLESLYITSYSFMPEGEYNHPVVFEEFLPGVLLMYIFNINKAAYKALTVSDGNTNTVTYTANVDGIVDGVVSYSPNMTFTVDSEVDSENIEITVDYHKSWGMQEEWNKFWDIFQNYGNRTDYVYAFAGCGWMNHPIFPPKYLIKSPSRCFGMFAYFNFGGQAQYDMTEICKYVDFSSTKYCAQLFRNAVAKNITLDLSNCTNTTEMFECYSGGSVDNITLKITENLSNTTKMFYECDDLKKFRFIEGSVLATSISFANSSKLSDESVDSIINALKDLTGATAKTLTVHANVYDRMVERGVDALVTAKNWTLVSG